MSLLALAIWLYLIFGRGAFWRVKIPERFSGPLPTRSVAVIIPARDEADVIGRAVDSLVGQRYDGAIEIFVVNDHSSDGTAEAAKRGESVTVLQADPLPPGWKGKLWALSCGLKQAALLNPDYFLFTDADIVHAPDNVARLVACAENERLDLASLMVKLRCESPAERCLIPAFLFFFLKLYPPAWRTGAAGGCILIRPTALERIGGIEAIRNELIDDCALAAAIRKGGPIWMGVTPETVSIRAYDSFASIEGMISRTAFTQLRHSYWMLAFCVAGMVVTYLAAPFIAILGEGWSRWVAIGVWLLMSASFLPTLRLYGRSTLWAPSLPLVTLFYVGATIHSAIAYATGAGGMWKGRVQDSRS